MYVVCVCAKCMYPTRSGHTNKKVLAQSATFVNCPQVPGLLEMSFQVLYDAVHDVALNADMYVQWWNDIKTTPLQTQGEPLAASSTPVAAEAEKPTVFNLRSLGLARFFAFDDDDENVEDEVEDQNSRASSPWSPRQPLAASSI